MGGVVLVITVNGETTRHEVAENGSATVGRSDACSVTLDDHLASRQHATFYVDTTGGVEVEDLASQNGTTVLSAEPASSGEGQTRTARSGRMPLEPHRRTRLGTGSVIQLGSALITFERAGDRRSTRRLAEKGVVVDDAGMERLYELAERVAMSDLSVLIFGESGVGKDVLAQFIHRHSDRSGAELVSINCGAISEGLLEAELFGYEKGAFTGAAKATIGLLEAADHGTLFLDEVGELPASFQVKLLRVLEDQTFMRVGGRETISVDVRFVAATNRDLPRRITAGDFREDLYYRLNGISLTVPPLRDRPSEIVPLAKSFIALASAERPGAPFSLTRSACEKLQGYSWPGNVRQLRNIVRRATVLSGASSIEAEDIQLPEDPVVEHTPASATFTAPPAASPPSGTPAALRAMAEQAERQQIVDALEACAGNQTRAAKMLGLTRRAFGLRLIKYDIPRPRK